MEGVSKSHMLYEYVGDNVIVNLIFLSWAGKWGWGSKGLLGFAWGRDKASNKPLSFPILEKSPPEFKATRNSREV